MSVWEPTYESDGHTQTMGKVCVLLSLIFLYKVKAHLIWK